MNDLNIIALDNSHLDLIRNFKSSDVDLSNFLVDDALNNQNIKISKTYLAFKNENLVGYITLLNDSIHLEGDLKQIFREKGVHYKSLPALKIGRLAVVEDFQRQGIGSELISFSIVISSKLNEYSACRFIVLDAKRNMDNGKNPLHFYKKIGFRILKEREKGTIPMYLDLFRSD
jgi:ribosomal protein S18 acetylase RimI-like enzyme